MKRDMDLIRRIALETSDMEFGAVLRSLDGVDQAAFAVHVMWMQEAGLLVATVQEYLGNSPPSAFVRRLTWPGCEFADAVRSDTVWKKAKEQVLKPAGSFTFDFLKDWLKSEITQGFPTVRSLAN